MIGPLNALHSLGELKRTRSLELPDKAELLGFRDKAGRIWKRADLRRLLLLSINLQANIYLKSRY